MSDLAVMPLVDQSLLESAHLLDLDKSRASAAGA